MVEQCTVHPFINRNRVFYFGLFLYMKCDMRCQFLCYLMREHIVVCLSPQPWRFQCNTSLAGCEPAVFALIPVVVSGTHWRICAVRRPPWPGLHADTRGPICALLSGEESVSIVPKLSSSKPVAGILLCCGLTKPSSRNP